MVGGRGTSDDAVDRIASWRRGEFPNGDRGWLEKKAIVTRVRSAEDRRVVHVELTGLGRETASSARLAKTKFHKSLLSNLSDEEQKHLLDLFRKIAPVGLVSNQAADRRHPLTLFQPIEITHEQIDDRSDAGGSVEPRFA